MLLNTGQRRNHDGNLNWTITNLYAIICVSQLMGSLEENIKTIYVYNTKEEKRI